MIDLTQGKEGKQIVKFSIPMILGNLLQQVYNMADGVVVGNYVGQDAFGAVGTAFPIMFLLIAFMAGLATGVSIIVSQLVGAKREQELRRSISTTYYVTVVFGLIAMVIGLLIAEPMLRYVLVVPDVVFADTLAYLRIMFYTMPFMFLFNVFVGLMRAMGDSHTPLYFLLFSTVLNIGLDIWFVAGFGLGVPGVAWATFLANVVVAVALAVYAYWKVPVLRIFPRDMVFDKVLFRQVLRLGLPSALQQTFMSAGMIAVQRLVNSFGIETMSAFNAGGRIEQVVTMPIMNMQMALSTFVAQNIGAGKMDRVERGFKFTQRLMVGTSIVCGVILVFGARFFIRAFVPTATELVLELGASYLIMIGSVVWVFYIQSAMQGVLRGAGDVMICTVSTVASFCMRLVLAYALARTALAQHAIWWTMPFGWLTGLVIIGARYKQGKWREIRILSRLDDREEGMA